MEWLKNLKGLTPRREPDRQLGKGFVALSLGKDEAEREASEAAATLAGYVQNFSDTGTAMFKLQFETHAETLDGPSLGRAEAIITVTIKPN